MMTGQRLALIEPRLGVRWRSALKLTAHANRRSESGLRDVDSIEADPFKEALSGAGCDLEILGPLT